jgi:hypothetical protein
MPETAWASLPFRDGKHTGASRYPITTMIFPVSTLSATLTLIS